MGAAQGFFKQAGLVVAAVEDGEVGVVEAVAALVAPADDAAGGVFGFVLFVLAGDDAHGFAFAVLAPEGFGEELGVVGDNLVGHAQDAGGGAVVLLELDDFESGVVLLEQAEVFHVGAAPGVDALVVVAHGGEAAFGAGEQLHEGVLAGVGVLAFVHQEVQQAHLPFDSDTGFVLQQAGGQEDEVVEIDGLVAVQGFLIACVEPGGLAFPFVGGYLKGLLGGEQVVFPQGDFVLGAEDGVAAAAAEQLGDDFAAVGAVEHGEVLFVADVLGFFAQEAHAQRVEGTDG